MMLYVDWLKSKLLVGDAVTTQTFMDQLGEAAGGPKTFMNAVSIAVTNHKTKDKIDQKPSQVLCLPPLMTLGW